MDLAGTLAPLPFSRPLPSLTEYRYRFLRPAL